MPTPPAEEPPIAAGSRYQLRGLLGAGGMGKVYRAWDAVLSREVALKFLREEDRPQAARFLQEARLQARVRHPAVCAVYDAGELFGAPFISMQLLHGRTLEVLRGSLTRDQKVELVARVAEAVQAAHEQGLVHRDLKPANVMVERGADGAWNPFVMDFGLARELSGPTLTRTGLVVGTPGYMAPEQIRGEADRVDARTDVYALGVTLYELLTGRLPHEGPTGVDLLLRVLRSDPPSPRHHVPDLDSDLETVVMTCLSREAVDRYASARAVAEDLRRYLAGEGIAARPETRWHRWARRLRRNPTLAAVGLAAAVLVATLGGLLARERSAAREAVRQAQLFGQEARALEEQLRVEYLLPLHDVMPARERMRRQLGRIEADLPRLGTNAAGVGCYALGRGYLALGEPEKARRFLSRAWESGYRAPEVALALGLAVGRLYAGELEEADRIPDRELRQRETARLTRTRGREALDWLRAAGDVGGREGGTTRAGAVPELVRALLAYYEAASDPAAPRQRWVEAAHAAARAADSSPALYEARLLEATSLTRLAYGVAQAGGEVEPLLLDASHAFRLAAEVGRSDPEVHEGACGLWDTWQLVRMEKGEDTEEAFREAQDACERALAADRSRRKARVLLALVLAHRAEHLMGRGESPDAPLSRALELAREVEDVDPGGEAAYALGLCAWTRAEHELSRGLDPSEGLREGLSALERAVARRSGASHLHNTAGLLASMLAEADLKAGRDPEAAAERAVGAFGKAVAMAPGYGGALNNLGNVWSVLAEWQGRSGADPLAAAGNAARAYERALALNPRDAAAAGNLADLWILLAEGRVTKDPAWARDVLREKVRPALEAARTVNPKRALTELSQGRSELLAFRLDPGRVESLERAREALRRATDLKHDLAEAWLVLAEACLEGPLDRRSQALGLEGRRSLERARALDPGNPRLPELEARLAPVRVPASRAH